jgi:signal peptidase I
LDEGREEGTGPPATLRAILEIPVELLVSFALVFGFVRPVVAAPFHIPTESMVPTLMVKDRLLVNKLAYDVESPRRGDIALFENQQGGEDPLIKRVVGLPGDVLELGSGRLFVNGEPLEEPYVKYDPCAPTHPKTCSFGPITVLKDHYFMMGDNRTRSFDSRFFGAVPEDDVIGEALVRFWPPGRAGPP